jgi:hypothetical protein
MTEPGSARRRGGAFARRIGHALALSALAFLAACAQPARVSQMVVPNEMAPVVAANPGLQTSLAVGEVSGGKETDPLWTSQVNNPEYKEALEHSLQANALLAPAASARNVVTVELIELKQPLVGFDMTVTSRVRYRVAERASSTEVFNEELTTPFTADFSSAAIAVERLRLANEGAIRESIRAFLRRYAQSWIARTPGSTPAQPLPPAPPPKPTS